ncbi:hypothetical protein [Sphingomonas phyllosphaerae]|nr:hypothetical protein [Sphingomonas phyllosphaerae]
MSYEAHDMGAEGNLNRLLRETMGEQGPLSREKVSRDPNVPR